MKLKINVLRYLNNYMTSPSRGRQNKGHFCVCSRKMHKYDWNMINSDVIFFIITHKYPYYLTDIPKIGALEKSRFFWWQVPYTYYTEIAAACVSQSEISEAALCQSRAFRAGLHGGFHRNRLVIIIYWAIVV